MVELAGLCRQTRLDIAQTLAIGELREGHHAKLFRACERSSSIVAAVALHDALEARPRAQPDSSEPRGMITSHGIPPDSPQGPLLSTIQRPAREKEKDIECREERVRSAGNINFRQLVKACTCDPEIVAYFNQTHGTNLKCPITALIEPIFPLEMSEDEMTLPGHLKGQSTETSRSDPNGLKCVN